MKANWMILALFLALPANATKVCQSIFNPYTGKFELQCVDRGPPKPIGQPPICRQVYDAMNNVFVTVCD